MPRICCGSRRRYASGDHAVSRCSRARRPTAGGRRGDRSIPPRGHEPGTRGCGNRSLGRRRRLARGVDPGALVARAHARRAWLRFVVRPAHRRGHVCIRLDDRDADGGAPHTSAPHVAGDEHLTGRPCIRPRGDRGWQRRAHGARRRHRGDGGDRPARNRGSPRAAAELGDGACGLACAELGRRNAPGGRRHRRVLRGPGCHRDSSAVCCPRCGRAPRLQSLSVAGLVLLATAAAMVACLALLPDRAGLAAMVSIAAAVGLPPGLAFGARVIGIEATFEAGDLLGLIGVAAAAAWALLMVGGARAIGLPGGRGHPATETFAGVSMAIAVLTLLAGPAIAAVQTGFANPVATEVMSTSALGGGLTTVDTVSSVLPAVTLFAPLLILGVLVYAVAGTSAIRRQSRAALFKLPEGGIWQRARETVRALTVPEQYRSILNIRELEIAAVGGHALLLLGPPVPASIPGPPWVE